MRTVLAVALGSLTSLAYVVIVGMLEVRAIGAEAGAVYDLSNNVVGITRPQVPLLPLLAVAALAAFVIYVLAFGLERSSFQVRLGGLVGFCLGGLVLVIWEFIAWSTRFDDPDALPGVAQGIRGWVEKGGQSSAVHIAVLVALSLVALQLPLVRRGGSDVPAMTR